MMPRATASERRQVLDPVDRLTEILFGLIMAMTFTGSLSAATAGHETVREMLIGALGCNLAWGLIDAVMYVMIILADRGRALQLARAVRRSASPEEAAGLIGEVLPPLIGSLLRPGDYEHLRREIAGREELPERPWLSWEDAKGAIGVFLLVVLTTFPLVIPFLVLSDPLPALRLSHGIAVTMLFFIGYLLGRHGGMRGLLTGLAMVILGAGLVVLTIALGG
jgi:hypothetical protein